MDSSNRLLRGQGVEARNEDSRLAKTSAKVSTLLLLLQLVLILDVVGFLISPTRVWFNFLMGFDEFDGGVADPDEVLSSSVEAPWSADPPTSSGYLVIQTQSCFPQELTTAIREFLDEEHSTIAAATSRKLLGIAQC